MKRLALCICALLLFSGCSVSPQQAGVSSAVPLNSTSALPEAASEATSQPQAGHEPLTFQSAIRLYQETGADIPALDEYAQWVYEAEGCAYYISQEAELEGFTGSFLYITNPSGALVEFYTPNVSLGTYYELAEALEAHGSFEFVWYNEDEQGLDNRFEVPKGLKEVKGIVALGQFGDFTFGEYTDYISLSLTGWYKFKTQSTLYNKLFSDTSNFYNVLKIQFIITDPVETE